MSRPPLGLFAGGGGFPAALLSALRANGHAVALVGIRGETDPRLLRRSPLAFMGTVGEFGRMIAFLKRAGAREAMMAGYVRHAHVFRPPAAGSLAGRVVRALLDRRADALLKAAAFQLHRAGIRVVSPMPYLGALVPAKGALTRRAPTAALRAEIEFGLGIARALAAQDVGQTVAVKARAVVAVEALEGTDATIRRAGRLAGPGVVVVKVARPRQDFRWDVPVIGLKTVRSLAGARAAALVVEAGRTIVLGRPAVIRAADRAGLTVVAV